MPGTPMRNVEGCRSSASRAAATPNAGSRSTRSADQQHVRQLVAEARVVEQRHHRERAIVRVRPHRLDVGAGRRHEALVRDHGALRHAGAARGEADQRVARGRDRGGHGARRAPGPDRLAAGVQPRERQQRRAGAAGARRHRLQELLVGQHEARLQQRDLLLQLVRAEAIAERRGDRPGVEAGEERDDPLDRVQAEDRDAIARVARRGAAGAR